MIGKFGGNKLRNFLNVRSYLYSSEYNTKPTKVIVHDPVEF